MLNTKQKIILALFVVLPSLKSDKWDHIYRTLESSERENIHRIASRVESGMAFFMFMFLLSRCVKIHDEATYQNCMNMGFEQVLCLEQAQRALENNRR